MKEDRTGLSSAGRPALSEPSLGASHFLFAGRLPLLRSQYSSGKSKVVTDRSASVIAQSFVSPTLVR